MAHAAAALSGGFDDPAAQSSRAFRVILGAMAAPGTIGRAEGAAPPAPVSPAMGLVALTLCDGGTPCWLSPALAASDFPDWLRFHCGAPVTDDRGQAAFAFGAPAELLPADSWPMGDPEYPDRGATLVLEVPGFDGAEARLSGPGIKDAAALPLGNAASDIAALRAFNAYPLGLDLILCAGDRFAALPRTTKLEG
ncbi:phosphonate C-P lyase system protein PhnH [Rhodovulum sp. DZ06]|uniref:phosphonate C-P lyase system protein PhnH n=1 Tax=Rhodovulum sp. DZ06 TaxID=3425126 RepID=UPI003D33EA15